MQAQDNSDDTPLHLAAGWNENPAVVEVLLAAGADVRAQNYIGETPLHKAVYVNRNPAVVAVVEILLAAGADLGAQMIIGNTPLHLAAEYGRLAIVEVLLAAGADVGAREMGGATPLHETNSAGIIEALVAAGADPAARDNRGNTPLHESGFRPAATEALIAAGADLAARNDDGATPLHMAAQRGYDVAIEKLVAAGAHPETRDPRGRTPLHFAADDFLGAAAIPALIAAGADPDRRDADGNTPLHLAASYVNPSLEYLSDRSLLPEDQHNAGDAINALLDAGANPTARNAAGETPWDRARANDALQQSDGYWRLNDARFEEPRENSSRRPGSGQPRRADGPPPVPARTGGPTCEIPGYPTPPDVQGLGLSWCGSNVGFQRRAFALQAAGAWCDIDIGSSSTAEQVRARHQEINTACDRLDALAAGGGPSCRCPAGYRP